MKQIVRILLLLAAFFEVFPAYGLSFEYDGFQFEVISASYVKLVGVEQVKSGTVTIPSTVTYEGRTLYLKIIDHFTNSQKTKDVTSVIIPNTVEEIGRSAFRGYDSNNNIRSITIPNSVKRIGGLAFKGCDNLEEVHISDIKSWVNINFEPDTYAGVVDGDYSWANPLIYAKKLLLNGETVTELNIPEGVEEIPNGCFYGLVDATSINLPNSLKKIGAEAFRSCNKVKEIRIPDNVSFIGQGAFDDCEKLEKVFLGRGISCIQYGAFFKCKSIKQVHVADLKTWCEVDFEKPIFIYQRWFSGAFYPYIKANANPLYYAHDLFINGEKIVDCEIPSGTTVIKQYTFSGCHSIKRIKIPNTVIRIEPYAFRECVNLEKVYIGSGITEIGFLYKYDDDYNAIEGNVFEGCVFLEEIHIKKMEPPYIASNTFNKSI